MQSPPSETRAAPPAPRFSARLRNYRGVAHFRSAVSFRGSNVKPNDPHAGHGGCGGGPQSGTASHLRAKDFQMILCEGTAGNSLHIGKAHSHKISEKNCSEAGPQHSCPANNSKPALPRAFYLLCYLSQLLAGIFDVCLRFVGARRRAPMPSHRCRHTASSSAPPLRLPKMQGAPPAPRFSALLRNYRGVAHFRSAVSFRGSTGRQNKIKARVAAGFSSFVLFRAITCGDS